jgi:hypothetical protein
MQRNPFPLPRLIALAFCFGTLAAMFCCTPLKAQTSYGAISGTVMDPTAAAIAAVQYRYRRKADSTNKPRWALRVRKPETGHL